MQIKIINTIPGMKEIKENMIFNVLWSNRTHYTFLFNEIYYSIYKNEAEILQVTEEINSEFPVQIMFNLYNI